LTSNSNLVSDESFIPNIKDDAKELSEVGEIKVVFHRALLPVWDPSARIYSPEDLRIPTNVHEKAMKGEAKSHGVM
jgi:hypothetical protein